MAPAGARAQPSAALVLRAAPARAREGRSRRRRRESHRSSPALRAGGHAHRATHRHVREGPVRLELPTIDDLQRLTEFFSALGIWGESEAELRDWLTNDAFDPEQDFRMAVEDGRVVGWCDVCNQDKA